MFNRCVIIGSGESLTEGLNKGIQDLLKNEVTFTLNEEFRFFDSTTTFFGDWRFYNCRYELLKHHPLIIGRWSREFDCKKLPQLILLPSCPKYLGQEAWKKGFYTGVLTGLFTLSVAIALGFDEIFMLGFDSKEINGKTHHYQGLEGFGIFTDEEGKKKTGMGKIGNIFNTGIFNKSKEKYNKYWDSYKNELNRIKIYNVSLESKIETFPKINYDEFISIIKNQPSKIDQDILRKEIKRHIKNHAKFNDKLCGC